MDRTLRTIFLMGPIFLFVLRCPTALHGQEAPVIKQIDIRGNQKVESDAIHQRIKIRVGDPFSPEKIRRDVENVFKMGFFDDVVVEAEELEGGLRVIYVVKEKPTIRSIQIQGASAIEEEDLRDQIDIAAGTIFNPQAVGRNADKIRAFYEGEGYYTAQVVGSFEKVSKQEVDVIFEVHEDAPFYVRDITFEGNEGLSDGKLSGVMATKERFFLPFLRPGVLKRSDLDQDVERLKALYFDNGYLQVKIAKPEIQVDERSKRLEVVIRIEEGPRFRVGDVKVVGSKVFPPEELLAGLRLPKEEFFGRDDLRRDMAFITGRYAELGYVFADVVPATRVRTDETIVDVTLEISEGIETFVERIEIRGNTKTRDKVIRRQLELVEGDVYNGKLLQEARAALGNLGYFEQVDVKTARGSAPNQLIVGIDVKEKPTGRVGFGGGFSTSGGALGSVFISEDNIFGYGKRVRLSATIGTVTNLINFRYDDPAFLDSDYSFGLGIFNRFSSFDDFDEQRRGVEFSLGRRFLKYNSASLGYLYETVDISNVCAFASQDIRDQAGETTTSSISIGFSRAVPIAPARSYRVNLNNEVAGGFLGADNNFYKIVLDGQYRFPVFEEQKITGFIRARGGLVEAYSDTPEVPIQERFFLGGAQSFRGAEFRELSPRDPVTGDRIGGTKFSLFTTEVEFPLWRTLFNLNGALFIDAANNFAEGEDFDLDFEYAFGVGVGVTTPFGPLRIDLAYNPDPTPETGNKEFLFHFNAGRSF
ncbi:MAG: outer membrane protein assembly factor BamA [Candidatus Methylomirabilales bacterium]